MSERYTQFLLDDFFPLYVKETDKYNFYESQRDSKDVFYNSIIQKKEFDQLRPYYGEPKPAKGEFLRHQEFMSRFMSPYTPYDKILVYHALGTGKSFTIAAVSELAKKSKTNQLSINKIIILVRNPNLKNNMVSEISNAFGYAPSKEEIEEENLSDKAIATRINKRLGVNYQVETFTTFVNQIKLMSDEKIKSDFSNTYIMIDEVHNLRIGKKDDRKNYDQIHRFLHLVLGCKILLLTATPMRDKPSEICNILNLLLPLQKQLNGKTFNDEYFQDTKFKSDKKTDFKKYLFGISSYLRISTSDVQVEYAGDIDFSSQDPMQFIKTVRLQMSDFQSGIYKEAYIKDKPSDENSELDVDEEEFEKTGGDGGIWLNSRQSSMFVFPDGTYGIHKIEKKEKIKIQIESDSDSDSDSDDDSKEPWLYDVEKIYKPSNRLKRYFTKYGSSLKKMLEQLKKVSIKFYFTIKNILENPTEKFFIYSNIVKGGGALLFGAILEIFGVKHVDPKSNNIESMKEADRCMVLTGSTLSSSQTDVLVNRIFNDPRNKYGEYIRVIVGSHVVGEGLSFKHIRKMFVLTPFWNSPTTDQAVGRAIRSFSHNDLPKEQQNVIVYRMASIPLSTENVQSIDMMMYKVSEDKDIRIKQVERLIKESAVDCALNRERNLISTDKPFSKECDYMEECNYRCEFVDDKYYSVDWVGERVQDTYNLYYAREEINMVKIIVKEAFSIKFTYDFEDLYNIILLQKNDLSHIVLARALNEIIMYNNPIINRFGFECYLREDRNLFFLIDDPFSPSLYTSAYYTANPEPDEGYQSFEEIIINYQYDKIERIIDLIIKNQKREEVLNKIFSNLSLHLIQQIIEIFLLAYFKKSEKNKLLQAYVYEKYGNYITQINDNIFLIIDTDNIKMLEKENNQLDWIEVSDEIKDELEKIKKTKLEQLEKTDWGYFGYLFSEKGKERFTIRIVGDYTEKKEGGVDKRTEREGLTCGTGKLSLKGVISLSFDLIEKAFKFNKLAPNFVGKSNILYTTNDILNKDYFKKYLYNTMMLNLIDMYINDFDEEDIKELVELCYNSYSSFKKGEQKLLKDLINDSKKTLKVPTKEGILEFIKKSPRDSILEHITGETSTSKDIIEILKENPSVKRIIRETIEKLPQSSKNNLGELLSNKTGIQICAILKDWFKENKLIIEGIK